MIKRILNIVGILMFASAAIMPLNVFGAEEPFSTAEPISTSRIFSKILPDFMSDNWFETTGEMDEEDVGKNLYFSVLKSTIVDPEEKSSENTARKYGISETDLNMIRSGSYQPILDKKPSITHSEMLITASRIRDQFDREYAKNKLQAELDAQTKPSEIFANNDVSDSGFDLIHDLELIEQILFLKTSPFFLGSAYNKNANSSSSAPTGQTQIPVSSGGGLNVLPGTIQNSNTSSKDDDSSSSSGQKVLETNDITVLHQDPSACFEDQSLKNAVTKFENENTTENNDNTTAGVGGGKETKSGSTSGSDIDFRSANDLLPELPSNNTPVNPAPEDDWSREKICLGTFCLFVNVEYKQPTSVFQDQDNCIACHVEKINDALKELVSHSLSPSKITGNPLEAPKCKSGLSAAFSAASMNINVQFMPIKTPLNDELIFNSDLANDWKTFCDATAFFPSKMCITEAEKPIEVDTPPLTSVLQRELTYAESGIDFSTLINRLDSAMSATIIPPAYNEEQLNVDKEMNPTVDMYKAVLVEMDQMNYYFLNFRDIFRSLHEKVAGVPGTQACTQLKNKEKCS
jgi:hypothetical protein